MTQPPKLSLVGAKRDKLVTRVASELETKRILPIKWIAEGLLHEGLFILAGKPKVGKSWLALHWAVCVANGFPVFNAMPTNPRMVYYLALEDPERRLRDRLAKMPGGFSPNLHYSVLGDVNRFDAAEIERLDEWLSDHPTCRLVVVDTLGRVKPRKRKNSDDYDDSVALGDILQRMAFKHHICLVLIYHNRKAEAPDGDYLEEVHGTIGLTGTADSTIVLKRKRKENKCTLHGISREFGEFEHNLLFYANDDIWTLTDMPVDLGSEQQRIYEMLKEHGPISPKPFSALLGKNYNTTKNTLERMAQKEIISVKDGKYYI